MSISKRERGSIYPTGFYVRFSEFLFPFFTYRFGSDRGSVILETLIDFSTVRHKYVLSLLDLRLSFLSREAIICMCSILIYLFRYIYGGKRIYARPGPSLRDSH